MAEITGRLVTLLHPNGVVRMIFIASVRGNGRQLVAKNLDAAELDFMQIFGLTPAKAAMLRARLERDETADVVITVEEKVAVAVQGQPR